MPHLARIPSEWGGKEKWEVAGDISIGFEVAEFPCKSFFIDPL